MGKVGRPIGTKLSDLTKNAIRRKRYGSKHSDKTKTKISESIKKWWDNRKENDPE